MKNIDKKAMVGFINKNSTTYQISKVTKIELQDWDGEEGCIGENYLVDFIRERIDDYSPNSEVLEIYGQALVDRQIFDAWYKSNNAVKFL